jgi:hypothetical protein
MALNSNISHFGRKISIKFPRVAMGKQMAHICPTSTLSHPGAKQALIDALFKFVLFLQQTRTIA